MFEGFEMGDFETGGIPEQGITGATIRYRHGGKGQPLLLLHGNPLSHVSWHKIANRLAERFHVVAMDLRGYGDSSAPEETGENHINFSFRAMAQDGVDLMKSLGYDKFLVGGHDRGARTAHRMAQDHPEKVEKLALVDILPSHHVWTNTSREWAMGSWHWIFMATSADLPETMMGAVDPRWFMEKKIGKKGIGLAPFTKEAFEEYVRCFNAKTIRGSCEDYRACITCDFDMDSADFGKTKVQCPTIVIWGKQSHTGSVWGDVLSIWKNYVDGPLDGGGIDCGHYVPEHAPDETYDWFMKHFAS